MKRCALPATVCCAAIALGGCVRYDAQSATASAEASESAPDAAHPAVFRDQGYVAAQAEAEEADRLFVVDATAAWCVPCKMMDRSTWVDARVVEWLETNAVAVQLDVDRETARAEKLGIQAMPTIIAFRGDRELGRVIGYQTADALLEWLKGLG